MSVFGARSPYVASDSDSHRGPVLLSTRRPARHQRCTLSSSTPEERAAVLLVSPWSDGARWLIFKVSIRRQRVECLDRFLPHAFISHQNTTELRGRVPMQLNAKRYRK